MLPPETSSAGWRGPYNGPAGPLQHVALIGCGVIGLPTALLLAQAGHRVTGVDINPDVVRDINDWTLELPEPELREVADEPGTRERMSGSLSMPEADVFIIAAPTPLDHEKKVCDYGAVDSVVNAMLPQLRKGNLILLESTVAPLCCRERIAPRLRELGFTIGQDIFLAFCPERVLPGTAWYELIHNDRVIGGFTEACAIRAAGLYRTFVKGDLVLTDCTTAELCKLAENAFRDVNIAFANELGLAADTLGVNRYELIGLANRHPRVDILAPGIGVGGHCLPIDPYFIGEADPAHARMIHTAREVNDAMPAEIARRIRAKIAAEWADNSRQPQVVGFGLTYKPNTPDVRESPATDVWKELGDLNLRVYDPLVKENAYDDFLAAVEGADFIFVIVPQQQVLDDLERHKETLAARRLKVFHQNQL